MPESTLYAKTMQRRVKQSALYPKQCNLCLKQCGQPIASRTTGPKCLKAHRFPKNAKKTLARIQAFQSGIDFSFIPTDAHSGWRIYRKTNIRDNMVCQQDFVYSRDKTAKYNGFSLSFCRLKCILKPQLTI
jgi:hypothetical protein